jgi:isopentenyl-diphosphate delta-isomerase
LNGECPGVIFLRRQGAWRFNAETDLAMDADRDEVILVDPEDREIGRASKLAAHREGAMHRAISVCIIDGQGRMLLQRRALGKYHSAGLWTNACCTHPQPFETAQTAAERRLTQEMGIACPLRWTLKTHYKADVGSNLVENEVVHLFLGFYSGIVRPDAHEVEAYAWVSRADILAGIAARPEAYTYWFRHYVQGFGDAVFPVS